MKSRCTVCYLIAVVAVVGVGSGWGPASDWASSLFVERIHDFGPVPRGAKVKHDFTLTNHLAEPIRILDLRTSCGCTSGKASASVVQPGESAVVEATMDTRNFLGIKSTVLTVMLITASGREAEVRLGVVSNILADIVLNPGSVDFGAVRKGDTPTRELTIDRIQGQGWRFERMVSASQAITAQLVETKRDPNGLVSYTLRVGLKPDAPAGPLRDEIRLISNDPETPSIPIPITAWIRGELVAAPSILALGQVTSAAGKQGKFVIRGSRPFRVTAVEGTGDGFSVVMSESAAKPVHVLTMIYRPETGSSRGDLRKVFRVHTDLVGEPPIDLVVTARAAP